MLRHAVISHLSVGEHSIDEEGFQRTMRYIFTFIEKVSISLASPKNKSKTKLKIKEKQAESIVEKLCQRFRLSEDTRQWRDIAFCLSLLPFKSERSVKKLIEGLSFYRDKLHEEGVYARFQEILVKVRHVALFPSFPCLLSLALALPCLFFSSLLFEEIDTTLMYDRLAQIKPQTNLTLN